MERDIRKTARSLRLFWSSRTGGRFLRLGLAAIVAVFPVLAFLWWWSEPAGSYGNFAAIALFGGALALAVVGLWTAAAGLDRLEQERERYSRQLRGLTELSLAVHGTTDVPGLLRAVAERTRRLIDARQAAVRLLVDDHRLEVSVPEGEREWREFYEKGAEALYETVRDRRQSVRLDTGELETDMLGHRLPASPLRGLLATPVVGPSGESIGVIVASDPSTEGFTETDEAILVQVAQMAAVAIENARLVGRLAKTGDEREEQTRLILEATEAERRHIARELHDELGQLATGVKLRMEAVRRNAPGYLASDIEQARTLLERLMTSIRDASFVLRPASLDAEGLRPALRDLFEAHRRQSGLETHFDQDGLEDACLSSEVETAVYRVVQEALTNVARHSGAKTAAVRIRIAPPELRLEVEDRGRGFDVRSKLGEGATGVRGMLERIRLLDGDLSIDSEPGRGTVVRCTLPISAPGQSADRAPR